jgi:hypothetical protein
MKWVIWRWKLGWRTKKVEWEGKKMKGVYGYNTCHVYLSYVLYMCLFRCQNLHPWYHFYLSIMLDYCHTLSILTTILIVYFHIFYRRLRILDEKDKRATDLEDRARYVYMYIYVFVYKYLCTYMHRCMNMHMHS